MATQGLKGIWGLQQLDRWFATNLQFVSFIFLTTVVLGAVIALLPLGWSTEALEYVSLSDGEVTIEGLNKVGSFGAIVLVVILATAITMSVLLIRLAEVDSRLLFELDPSLDPDDYRLSISRLRLFFCILFFAVMHVLSGINGMFNPVFEAAVGAPEHVANSSTATGYLWARLSLPLWNGSAMTFIAYFVSPITFIASGLFLELVIARSAIGCKIAREIRIELILLDRYSVISNDFVRVIVVVSVLCTLLIIGVYNLLSPDMALANVALLIIIALPFFYWLGKPVFILRQRIRQKKLEDMGIIQQRLLTQEDTDASPGTLADLVASQLFIESRWEWPIATHLQKLILFGMLPPMTWVLAATIENMLY